MTLSVGLLISPGKEPLLLFVIGLLTQRKKPGTSMDRHYLKPPMIEEALEMGG